MYKLQNEEKTRKLESAVMLRKYPDRIPIIIEQSQSCKDLFPIDKNKFLVPNDLTMGQFVCVIRKRLKLPPEKALFLFVSDVILKNNSIISNVYDEYKDKDGFLYIFYSSESTFGC